jgi:kynurenine formamidase
MKLKMLMLGLISFAILTGCQKTVVMEPFTNGRFIDLTHSFSSKTVYWPTSDTFKLETVFQGETKNGFYYAANRFCAAEHGGTHLDAPIHFRVGGQRIDQIPIEKFIGQAVVVDVSEKALAMADYQVNIEDFQQWEAKNGKIPEHSMAFIYTGYGRYWQNRQKYLGTEERGQDAVAKLHFPGLHPQAAAWLAKERRVKAIGLDTASIDYGQSKLFETHQILSQHSVAIFENIANLEQLPAIGATVIALPMKIEGGSGAPLRIVAMIPHR